MTLWVRIVLATASPDALAGATEAHRAQVRELERDGRLRLALELDGGDGFVDVFEAADRHEAERIARASAVVEAGLGSVLLRPCVESPARDQASSAAAGGGSTQRP